MKNSELYHKTVNVLVDAYFNDTLEHNNCYACAVGNIVAASCDVGFRLSTLGSKIWDDYFPKWDDVFMTAYGEQQIFLHRYYGEARRQIDSTGYKLGDLSKIEFAFETADRGKSAEDYMFNGLMSVIEALDEIHENNDTKVTETSKSKFQKQTA